MANAVYVASGHGGNDTGATGNGLLERDLNAGIVRVVVAALRRSGIKTYTDLDIGNPPTPTTVPDSKKHPDVVIYLAVHHNSGPADARGTECYVTGSGRSARFGAVLLAAHFNKISALDPGFKNRGVREAIGTRAEYEVTQSQGSSALLESLFVTSSADAMIAKRTDYFTVVGETLAKTIIDFGRNTEHLWTTTYIPPGPAPTDPCADVKKERDSLKAQLASCQSQLAAANRKISEAKSVLG